MPPNYRLYTCIEKIPRRVAIVPVTPSSSQESVIPRIALRQKRLLLVH